MSRSVFAEIRLRITRSQLVRSVFIAGATMALFGLASQADAQCSGTGTVTYTSSGNSSSPAVKVVGGTISTSASNISVSVPAGSVITCVSVVLNGVTTNGETYLSMNYAGFMLTAPGGQKLEFLGSTGDGTDGDDLDDAGSGLAGLVITVADNAANDAPAYPAHWQNSGSVTVKPSSYYLLPANNTGVNPPLPAGGNSTEWAQSDGSGTFTKQFVSSGAAPSGTWTLSLSDNNPYNPPGPGDPVSVNNWSLVMTTMETTNLSTTTSLSSSSSNDTSFTSGANGSVTLTATVTSGGSDVTSGTVTFTDGGNTLCSAIPLNGSGEAACITTLTTEGLHALDAAYSGATGYSTSSSPGLNQFVKNHSTLSSGNYCNSGKISENASTVSPYPSVVNVGTDTTALTSTVADLKVTLNGLSASSGLGPGYAYLLVAPDKSKAYNLTFLANAGGSASQPSVDLSFADNNSSAPLDGPLSANTYEATDLSSSASAFMASTSPAPALPGTINYAQPDYFGTSAVNLSTAFGGADGNGDWALYAYNETGVVINVTGGWCLSFTLNNGAITTTSLASSANPGYAGSAGTLTATVTSGGNPVTTGTVTIIDNSTGTTLANGVTPNGSGQVQVSTSTLSEGDHDISASYSGVSGTWDPSSATVWQREDHATTLSGLGTSSSPAVLCNPGGITLPNQSLDAGNVGAAVQNPSNIFARNLPGTISSVELELENFQNPSGEAADTILWTSSLLVGPGATTANSIDFFSGTGTADNDTLLSAGNYFFSDTASATVPQANFGPSTYEPTSYSNSAISNKYTASPSGFYTLPGSWNYAQPRGSTTFGDLFDNTSPNGVWSLYLYQNTHVDGPGTTASGWCMSFVENPVTVSVDLSHQGDGTGTDFVQGETGAQITTEVAAGDSTGPTGDLLGNNSNPLTVVDTLNSALTYTGFSGTGWTCSASGQVVTCTNDSSVAQGASYPALTFNVSVSSSAPSSIGSSVSVNGAGIAGNSGSDTITIDQTPVLSVSKSHSGNFTAGTTGLWTIVVSNTAAGSATSGTVTVSDTLPSGYAFASYTSTSSLWNCSGSGTITCTATPGIAGGSSSTINLTVDVTSNSPTTVTNTAFAWGGGDTQHTNSGNAAASNIDSVSVSAPPAITSGASTTFIVGTTGTFSVTATGDPAPTFSESGALPSGITLSSSGVLSGKPAANSGGTYTFTITATNGITPDATQSFTLTVNQSPAITSAAGTTFTAGTAGSFTATASGYPAPTFSETGALPSGVTLSSSGVLSGTPTAGSGGTYTFTITASNGIGSNATQSFTLTVNQSPNITSAAGSTFTAGAASTFTATASGYPAATFSETGALPSGVTLSSSGMLSGTPAVNSGGIYTFTITASNGIGSNATQTFTLTVDQTPVVTSASGATLITGVSGAFTVITTAYPMASLGETGSLPSGVTFIDNGNGTATLAGTPALGSAGSYPITIRATNGVIPSAMQNFTLTVNLPPTYVVTTNADDAAGTPSDCPIPSSGNTCTLRDALAAVAATGAGNITFDPTAFATAQTITLTNGTLNIPTMTTITGPTSGSVGSLSNLVTVAGGGPSSDFPVFNVNSSAIGTTIANFKITNGYSSTTCAGGLLNGYQSGLTVINSTITGNSSTSSAAGIFNDYGATLTVIDSSISGNAGAAIVSESGGTVAITSSTIFGNSGSGIANAGSAVTINASTISGNTGGYSGGGINTSVGTVTLANAIVVGNFATSSPDIYGTYTDGGGNFVGGVNGVTASSVNLAALGNFGGPTQTMIPLPGSAAICGGLASSIPTGVTTDQRGFALDPTCASGSVDAGAIQTNQYVVNTLVDSNDGSCTSTTCSLRDAIGAAKSSGGDITFLSSLTSTSTPGIINLSALAPGGTGSTLAISGANILGPGANQLTVAGDDDTNVGSVLTVNSGAQAFLYGLTIAQGYSNGSGGGINNGGILTVMDSAISSSMTTGNGGGIYSGGTLTLTNSTVSGNSAAFSNGTGSGGGIYSTGTLTLTESTVAGNSVSPQSTGGGGGIFIGAGSAALTGSTVSGNTAAAFCPPVPHVPCMGGTGGGIYNGGTLTAENSIVAGNSTMGTANSGDCQNCGTLDSSNLIGGTPELSGLEANGVGATVQTMIPLPGSPAICGGLASNIPSGTTTDERGFPTTNTTYAGYSPTTPCVDAGAVQTNYAISFTTQPPSSGTTGAALNPAPVVTLTESGTVFTAGPGTIAISDADADLNGSSTISVSTTAGAASFSNLKFTNAESGDTLTATVALNPAISATSPAISSVSNPFNVALAGPPFGNLDSAVDSLSGESPVGQSDSVVIKGWAADQVDGAPLGNVTVYIDGTLVGTPTLGIARPGVATAEGAAYLDSGYQLSYSAATLAPGSHAVTVMAIDSGGRSTTFGPLNFTVVIAPPFGNLDSALDSVTGQSTVGQSHSVVIKGWAADQTDGAPLSNVKVYIDDTLVGTPTLGIARPGVAAAEGTAYLDSGYQLSYSAAKLASGSHAVTVIAIDSGGRSTRFGPLGFTVVGNAGAPFGNLDSAFDSLTGKSPVGQSDSVVIKGWAADHIDGAPLSNVTVYIDGNPVGTPTLGIARADVAAVVGAYCLNSGYQLSYSASTLALGSHAVTVVAIDSGGRSSTFGPLNFTVAATPPFGNLDSAVDSVTRKSTVGQSDSVVIKGWAADQVDGAPLSNVTLYIDGNPVGTPTLGIARPGVAAAYGAGYLDSGYQLSYSASTLALGPHAVTVVAIDSGGRSTTFGPLNFTVQ